MNHWHTVDHLAAGRRADLNREAAGNVRIRAARLAAGGTAAEDRTRIWGVRSLVGRRPWTQLRSVLPILAARGVRALRLGVVGWRLPRSHRYRLP